MKTFGMKIREERKKRNMTQTEFAEKLGVSMRMVGDYETGKRRPHRAKMKAMAEILELPYEYLVDDRYETVLSVFNGVMDDTPAEKKYVTVTDEPVTNILNPDTGDATYKEKAADVNKDTAAGARTQRAIQEASFISAKAQALFAGGDLPLEVKDKFFEALYDSYLACRAQAVEDGITVDGMDIQKSEE